MSGGGGRPAGRRCFFALWPADAERQALAAACAVAVGHAGGRAVPVANLHLTFEFLGAVPDTSLATLAMLGAAVALPDECLVLDRLDGWRRAGMLVASSSAPPAALIAVQAELRAQLKEHGFRVDSRPFRPHVTLARRVEAWPSAPELGAQVWRLETLALVESAPTPAGSRYVPLARWTRAATHANFSSL